MADVVPNALKCGKGGRRRGGAISLKRKRKGGPEEKLESESKMEMEVEADVEVDAATNLSQSGKDRMAKALARTQASLEK